MMGSHLVKSWSRTQDAVTLSSAEAELTALGKLAMEMLGVRSMCQESENAPSQLHADASAALPDDAAGVDMFGNPVSESGELLGDAAAADFEAFEAFPDDAPLPPGFEEPAETLAAAAAFQEDVAGPAEVTYREADFVGSEWKIGVLWRDKEKIDVTWVRCKEDGNSEWGWGANGKWRLEDGSFLTFTRDFPLGWNGKRLFSARVGADGNFVEGVVRGWKPFESATIMGEWQAIRLGVEGPQLLLAHCGYRLEVLHGLHELDLVGVVESRLLLQGGQPNLHGRVGLGLRGHTDVAEALQHAG